MAEGISGEDHFLYKSGSMGVLGDAVLDYAKPQVLSQRLMNTIFEKETNSFVLVYLGRHI